MPDWRGAVTSSGKRCIDHLPETLDMNYLVSRHPGALEWMQRRVPARPTRALAHLGPGFRPKRGDRVYGVLPLAWVERIQRAGAEAWVLEVDLPEELRGRELGAAELDALQARLVRYEARVIQRLA